MQKNFFSKSKKGREAFYEEKCTALPGTGSGHGKAAPFPVFMPKKTVNDTVSAQGPEDAADTETPSDAPETDATGSDDNTNHAPSTPEGDGKQNQDHEKEDTTEVPSVETPEETPVVPPAEEGEGTTVPSDDVKDEEEKQEEAEEKEEVKEEETEEERQCFPYQLWTAPAPFPFVSIWIIL